MTKISSTANISELVVSSLPYLVVLHKCCNNKIVSNSILQNKTVAQSLSEIVYNLLHNNFNLSIVQKAKLKKYKKLLYLLAKKNQLREKRKVLGNQPGRGCLSIILSVTLPAIIKTLRQNGSTKHRK